MNASTVTKIKKYAAPNIPYIFIGWVFLKLSTAFRMAEGANVGQRLMSTIQYIGPALADIAPGLNPIDWLVGITGAVLMRLYINQRTKKAQKFRRDAEYGTARWGVYS